MKYQGRPESDNIIDRQGYQMTPAEAKASRLQGKYHEAVPHFKWPDRIAEDKFAPVGNQAYSDPTFGDSVREFDQEDFLIDTFKRARSVGFPIHPFEPYLKSLPSTAFEGQADQ